MSTELSSGSNMTGWGCRDSPGSSDPDSGAYLVEPNGVISIPASPKFLPKYGEL